MELESERLLLRRYQDEDFDFLYSLLKNPAVMRYVRGGLPKSRQQALEFLYWIYRSYREHPSHGLLLLMRKEDGVRIGHAGLVEQCVAGHAELEVGYWLAPEFQGSGYAKEAAALLCREAFKETTRNRLISLIQSGNGASCRVAEALGMEKREELELKGKKVCLYQLEKERWHGISNT